VLRRIPAARFERLSADAEAVWPVSERFLLGLAAVSGDAFGPASPDLLPDGSADAILDGNPSAAGRLPAALSVAGAPTPAIDGRGDRWVGTWPPFEALENQGGLQALVERERVELRLKVLAYLGDRSLPGEVGADLFLRALDDMSARFEPETARDWESYVRWVDGLDKDYFDARLRACLTEGLYRLQAF
jgi:hypothetical protein